jgi:hypothetical protein
MKTFKSKEHLEGMIEVFIYLYDLHVHSISEELGLGFEIVETDNTFKVILTWISGYKPCRPSDTPEPVYSEDWFIILKDESITKLEQYVSDSLSIVKQTELAA